LTNRYNRIVCGLIFVVGMPTAVQAKSPEEKSLEPFERCRVIAEDEARLACFDSTLILAKKLALEERDQRRDRTKKDFGLSTLQIERRDDSDAKTDSVAVQERRDERAELEPDKIVSKIIDTYTSTRSKKKLFILENGQIWKETSTSTLKRPPKINSNVTISRSGFGGFRMRVEGRSIVLYVKRIK